MFRNFLAKNVSGFLVKNVSGFLVKIFYTLIILSIYIFSIFPKKNQHFSNFPSKPNQFPYKKFFLSQFLRVYRSC